MPPPYNPTTGPRVTPADVVNEIAHAHFFTAAQGCLGNVDEDPSSEALGALDQVTFCVLILRNGTKVVGVNYGAIDPAQHSAERGREEAQKQAMDKVFELLGFRLRDDRARLLLIDPRPAHLSGD